MVFHVAHVGLLVIGNSPVHKSHVFWITESLWDLSQRVEMLWGIMITYDEFWRYDNLWWFMMIYHNLWFLMIYMDYEILPFELFIMKVWRVWFDITQAKWVIIVHMHVFMKLMMLFKVLHAPPHTQYILFVLNPIYYSIQLQHLVSR